MPAAKERWLTFQHVVACMHMLLLLAGIAACISLTWALWTIRVGIRPILTDTRRVVLSLGGTAKELREAAGEWKSASRVQADSSTAILRKTEGLIDHLDDAAEQLTGFVRHADEKINSEMAPAITKAVTDTSAQVAIVATASAKAIQQTAAELKPVAEQAVEVLTATAKVVSDPNIPIAAESIAKSGQHLEEIGQKGIKMAEDGSAVTADLREAVHRATRPGSLAMRVANAAFGLTSRVGSVIAGFFRGRR